MIGCFYFRIRSFPYRSSRIISKNRFNIRLTFTLIQHSRDDTIYRIHFYIGYFNYILDIYKPVFYLNINYKFLQIINYPPLSNNTLKAMPFKLEALPEFVASVAIIALNIVLGNIDNQLSLLNDVSSDEQLRALQLVRENLRNILKKDCAEANTKIAYVSNEAT